jgi:hypothetical protein
MITPAKVFPAEVSVNDPRPSNTGVEPVVNVIPDINVSDP